MLVVALARAGKEMGEVICFCLNYARWRSFSTKKRRKRTDGAILLIQTLFESSRGGGSVGHGAEWYKQQNGGQKIKTLAQGERVDRFSRFKRHLEALGEGNGLIMVPSGTTTKWRLYTALEGL